MMRARLRIWAVLSFFPFMTPTCCMHVPRESSAGMQESVQATHVVTTQAAEKKQLGKASKEAHTFRLSDFVNP